MTAALYDGDGRLLGPQGRAFTDEQADAIRRREGPLLLAANAGSGKTSVLVERFVRMVAEDEVPVGRILAITFTEKAAGELRARVRARLLELGLREAARDAEGAWISTIHGFCARILRAHAVAAGLDPRFVVLDEAAARALRREAFDAALGDWLGDPSGPPRGAELDLAAAYGADALGEMVMAAHDELRSRGQGRPALPVSVAEDPGAALAELRHAAHAARAALRGARSLATIDKARAALGACADALEALAPGEHPTPAACDAWVLKAGNVAELREGAPAAYAEAWARYRQAVIDAQAAPAAALLGELLGGYADAYAAAKRARSAVDFSDLELLARDLLRDAPAIARGLRERFQRVMVDEFQDTNPLQLELLELLGVEHVFVVGDELQSIYGFRHADVEVFRARRERLEREGRAPTLATSFRSRPELLATLNAAFGPRHGRGYVPLVPGRAEPRGAAPVVELLVTDAPAWDGTRNGVARAPDAPPELLEAVAARLEAPRVSLAAEARLVAQRVRELVDAGDCGAGDVVVLVRTLAAMLPIERALEDAGLATLPSAGKGWWERRQVADLLAWLAALANPRDEVALLSVLASPLGGASSDALALLHLVAGPAALWDVLEQAYVRGGDDRGLRARVPADDDARLEHVVGLLAAERAAAPRYGLDELLDRAVRATGYDEHVLSLAGGARRLANVRKLQRLAAAFEAREGRDVRGFVDLANAEVEADATETDAPVDLGDQDAVRLMTMHAAKGLEFPVVVCAGLGRVGNRSQPALLVDGDRLGLRLARLDTGDLVRGLDFEALAEERRAREMAEERRILHVAMTRAEDRLILSGATSLGTRWPNAGHGCPPLAWIGPELFPGVRDLDPAEPEITAPVGDGGAVRVLLNSPATVGRILRDPREAAAGEEGREGEAAPQPLAPPRAAHAQPLAPEREDGQLVLSFGDSEEPTPEAPVAPPESASPALAPPSAPPPVVSTVSYTALGAYAACGYRFYLQRVLRLPEVEPPPHLREARAGATDPRLRGSIVHVLLEHADLRPGAALPDAGDVAAVASDMGAVLDEEQVADVLRLLDAFGASGVRDRLAAARDVRREHAFALPLGSSALLTGVVDVLAVEEGGKRLVVDYKTDRLAGEDDLPAVVARDYALQRAAYALAALRDGAPEVELVHLYLERPHEPVAARFAAGDMPALGAVLREAAAGPLAGEYRVAAEPHAALCASCPGRGGLCSWPLEMTDRPEPAPAPTGAGAGA